MKPLLSNRFLISEAPRLVIKVGSSSLTASDGSLNLSQLEYLVQTVADARERGQSVVLVSSGAVAAGITPLGMSRRPSDVRSQQAAAMVGQTRLMAAYSQYFAAHGLTIGQVLLTPDDVVNRRHYINAQRSLKKLLHLGVVPIVNENDAVVTDDLRFGDNDRLAALVAHLVDATALVLCTDVDALYTLPPDRPGARRIAEVNSPQDLAGLTITGKGSDVGTGGMRTKVEAADIATSGGVASLLVATEQLQDALAGKDVGTWFVPRRQRSSARSLWLRYVAQIRGQLTVDDGAASALRAGGVSLLAVGINKVSGSFAAGDLVQIVDGAGKEVARGLVAFSDGEVRQFIAPGADGSVPIRAPRPVVHADDLTQR